MYERPVVPEKDIAARPLVYMDSRLFLNLVEKLSHDHIAFLKTQTLYPCGESAANIENLPPCHRMLNHRRMSNRRGHLLDIRQNVDDSSVNVRRSDFIPPFRVLNSPLTVYMFSERIRHFFIGALHIDVIGFPFRCRQHLRVQQRQREGLFMKLIIGMPIPTCSGYPTFLPFSGTFDETKISG